MDPRFFLPCFHGHKRKEKNSVHNLPYGPRTRLIRDMYCAVCILCCAVLIVLCCVVLYSTVLYCEHCAVVRVVLF